MTKLIRNVIISLEESGFSWFMKFMRKASFSGAGVDAKFAVQDGLVKVNGQVETQRGKKLVEGDIVEYDGNSIKITG